MSAWSRYNQVQRHTHSGEQLTVDEELSRLGKEDQILRNWQLEIGQRLRSLEKKLGLTYDTDARHVEEHDGLD